jgi:hypothetical protein
MGGESNYCEVESLETKETVNQNTVLWVVGTPGGGSNVLMVCHSDWRGASQSSSG